MLQEMRTSSTNMVLIAQELCQALGIDVAAILRSLQDHDFSGV
jgi:hypothetical protein